MTNKEIINGLNLRVKDLIKVLEVCIETDSSEWLKDDVISKIDELACVIEWIKGDKEESCFHIRSVNKDGKGSRCIKCKKYLKL